MLIKTKYHNYYFRNIDLVDNRIYSFKYKVLIILKILVAIF